MGSHLMLRDLGCVCNSSMEEIMTNALFRFGSSQRHSSSHKYATPASIIILCD